MTLLNRRKPGLAVLAKTRRNVWRCGRGSDRGQGETRERGRQRGDRCARARAGTDGDPAGGACPSAATAAGRRAGHGRVQQTLREDGTLSSRLAEAQERYAGEA